MNISKKKYNILKIRDKNDSYYTKIEDPGLFDLPFRILINGRSQNSGKTTIILNLLANPEFPYSNLFKGENIYIISNNKLDNKLSMLADRLEIPKNNCTVYDEDYLEVLYEQLENEFMEETAENDGKGTPENRLIIFDDCGYGGDLKNKVSGVISRMICNGRHINLSQVYTSQKFSQCSTVLRTNVTGAILFGTSQREIEAITDDFSYFEKKADFVRMFKEATKKPRSFLVVNLKGSLNADDIYFNSNFEPIKN